MENSNPVLRYDQNYIVIWGYWNKPDEILAQKDSDYYQAINALRALQKGILSRQEYMTLMQKTKEKLAEMRIEDLCFSGKHKLLSMDSSGKLIKDDDGFPEVRICNFELFKKC